MCVERISLTNSQKLIYAKQMFLSNLQKQTFLKFHNLRNCLRAHENFHQTTSIKQKKFWIYHSSFETQSLSLGSQISCTKRGFK